MATIYRTIILHIVNEKSIEGIHFDYLPQKGEQVIINTPSSRLIYEVYRIINEVDLTNGQHITYHLYLAAI